MMLPTVIPSENELKQVLVSLRAQNATLGVPKIHSLLLSTHPTWRVSEKRTRKVLQAEGLMVVPPTVDISINATAIDNRVYPVSNVMEELDVGKWTTKVEVKYFGKVKGKGLVAREAIQQGEVVWREDPFVIAPEWEIFDLQQRSPSRACAFCTTPFGNSESSLVIGCPASAAGTYCPARFCNRLCLARSVGTHALLCPAQNPASTPLVAFARKQQWMALHALAQCTAHVLMANQRDEAALRADLGVVRGFAELGMEERWRDGSFGGSEPDRATWRKAHQLFLYAFQDPPSPLEKKKLSRILRKPLAEHVGRELFDYDAFLRGLGRMSLNLEAHGGLYILHSHLNHACAPNISVRHLEQQTALSRITLVAKCDIGIGEELLVTYVDPDMGFRERRHALAAWGFGVCRCVRCLEEENDLKEGGDSVSEKTEMRDLATELKAELGLF